MARSVARDGKGDEGESIRSSISACRATLGELAFRLGLCVKGKEDEAATWDDSVPCVLVELVLDRPGCEVWTW